MRKNILFDVSALAALLMAAGCSGSKTTQQVETNPLGQDWDSTCAPMPMYGVVTFERESDIMSDFYLLHVMESQEDSARFAPVADTYHVEYVDGEPLKIKYTEIQNGPEIASYINRDYGKYMKGFRYDQDDETVNYDGDGIAFSDKFLENHTIVGVNCYAVDESGEYDVTSFQGVPTALQDTIKARYQMEIQKCHVIAETPEANVKVYSFQMAPKDSKALGLRVVTVGDTIYTNEDWAQEFDGVLNWHVDYDGNYFAGQVAAITRGELGYDVFFLVYASESVTYKALLLRDGKVNVVDMASYYIYVDYTPPLDVVSLPEDSELKAELDGYKVWIHIDQQGDAEGNGAISSVYYSRPDSKDVYHLVTAGANPWAISGYEPNAVYVEGEDLNTAQEAFIAKKTEDEFTQYRLILQGCPDARNVYCFVISLPVENQGTMYRWIRCFEGYKGMDETTHTLMFDDYRYHEEGGRYTIRKYFDFNLNEVKEETLPE